MRTGIVLIIALAGCVIGPGISAAAAVSASQHPAPTPAVTCAGLPGNLTVVSALRPLLDELRWRSPTFRRQLARLARERPLVVSIAVWSRDLSASARARTRFTRTHGSLEAAVTEIQLLDASIVAELVAHEFEHVLEQLDGVDLHRWSGRSGVRRLDGGTGPGPFETERARRVGLAVASEYAASRAVESSCSGERQ